MTKDNAAAARDLAGRFWEGLLALEPMIGTYIGDDRYDDRLPDPSDDGVAARKAFMEKSLAERSKIDAGPLDVELRTTLDVLESLIRDAWALALGRPAESLVNKDLLSELQRIADELRSTRAAAWLKEIEELRGALEVNLNRKIASDGLMMKLAAA